ATGQRLDPAVSAQRAAQRGDLNRQVALLDCNIRPGCRDQRILGDHGAGPLGERTQQGNCPAPEVDGLGPRNRISASVSRRNGPKVRIVGIHASGNHGFLLSGGIYTTLDAPGAIGPDGTSASGINAAGQIVGSYRNSTGSHGFLLNGSTYTTLDDNLATLG